MAERTCFVIAPIGEDGSDVRRRSDQIMRYVIRPALEPLGLHPVRADEIAEPGMITNQIIQHVVDDALVVADLSGRNPNVFYELAVRHLIQRPLVQIISHDESIPFDLVGSRTIRIDHKDLDSVASARKAMTEQAKFVLERDGLLDSPISMARDLKALSVSPQPRERSMGEILSAVSIMQQDLRSIESRLGRLGAVPYEKTFWLGVMRSAIQHIERERRGDQVTERSVFLSYEAKSGSAFYLRLRARLEGAGFVVKPGVGGSFHGNILKRVMREIRASEFFVAIFTPSHAVKENGVEKWMFSSYVAEEKGMALAMNKPFLVLVHKDVAAEAWVKTTPAVRTVEFHAENFEEVIDEVVSHIQKKFLELAVLTA